MIPEATQWRRRHCVRPLIVFTYMTETGILSYETFYINLRLRLSCKS